jgi:hypothetical protein
MKPEKRRDGERRQRSEVRSQRSEDNIKTEVGGRPPSLKLRRAKEVRDQKTG